MIATPATLAIGTTAPIFDNSNRGPGRSYAAKLLEGVEEEFVVDPEGSSFYADSITINNLSECWLKIKVETKHKHNLGDSACPISCIYIPPAGNYNINLGDNTVVESICVAAVEAPEETEEIVGCDYNFATLNPASDVYALITLNGTCPPQK